MEWKVTCGAKGRTTGDSRIDEDMTGTIHGHNAITAIGARMGILQIGVLKFFLPGF